jgi:3-hydroxyacyl-[acyl-carrier-protein] dehydratase
MILNKDDVLNFLPHRDPFLFVDSVKEVIFPEGIDPKSINLDEPADLKKVIGTTIISAFTVREDMEILKGHFPGNPIIPGVVQLEMMAQCSILLKSVLADTKEELISMKVDMALLGVDKARFRVPVVPGMDLEFHSTLKKIRGSYYTYYCEVYNEGKLCSSAEIFAFLKLDK